MGEQGTILLIIIVNALIIFVSLRIKDKENNKVLEEYYKEIKILKGKVEELNNSVESDHNYLISTFNNHEIAISGLLSREISPRCEHD